jgi:predicted acetyltransferase
MTPRLDLQNVPRQQSGTLANLLQLYLHDFSEFAEFGTARGEVGPDGRFPYQWLDYYWQEEGRVPLFIRADGQLAGFALVNRWSALNRPLDHAMAEFFILRRYRRQGIGSLAAAMAFARFPGRWEVPATWYNRPALAFWRRAISAAIGENPHEHAVEGERWHGTVFCFIANG